MNNDDYQHFVCIVAGDDPSVLMAEYDKNIPTAPKLVYKHSEIKKIKESFLKLYEGFLSNDDLNDNQKQFIKFTIQDISEMDDEDFYEDMVSNTGLEVDPETGDAYSTKNLDGKWSSYTIGKIFSVPFLTKDGKEVFQARKGDIDWPNIHLHGGDIYGRAWEMVMEGSEPQNDYERTIYENMKDKHTYFEKFETKSNYITSNTAFWGYAFLSEKTGWLDASDGLDQFAWMSNFYDMFIKNLDDNTLLTIYECKR